MKPQPPAHFDLPDLNQVMRMDRHRLQRRIDGLRSAAGRGQNIDVALRDLVQAINASAARRKQRLENLPKPKFPEELPVVARRAEIAQAIRDNQVVVICGETGSGKTTQLPKICMELGRGVCGLIGHTQPRRIAARSVASRIASELNSPLGQAVGFKIRFTDQTSPNSYLKLMTDGILLAESQQDRYLDQYDTIIIDEAHERSLNIDFLLGYLRQLLPRRSDLKVIITSATIDPQRFAQHFSKPDHTPAPIIEVSGRTYPVEVMYRPLLQDTPATEDTENPAEERDPLQAILDAVDELARLDSASHSAGNMLIFLSSEREIRETAEALREHKIPGGAAEVVPLYARLGASEQQRVFASLPSGFRRRIVLATNVAETSLTVPGIDFVIDPGSARISRYSSRTKVQRLPIEAISQASANQRKGRCGRTGPGVCIRLYSEEDFNQRPAFTIPEIQRTNLANVILQMTALNLGHVGEFPFIDPPEERMIRDGYQTLHELGAVDEKRQITPIGRALAKLPIDPRLGRMILAANGHQSLTEVLVIAAALSIPDPRERPLDKQAAADQAHELFRVEEPSDFLSYVKLWHAYHEQHRTLSRSGLRKWCQKHFLSWVRMREWLEIHQQLHSLCIEAKLRPNVVPADYEAVHRALLTGLLGQVGTKGETHEYLGARNNKFSLWPGSALFKKNPKWVMASELVQTARLFARTVASIEPAWIEDAGPHLVQKNYSEPHWDARSARVMAYEKVSLYGLTIVPRRRVHYGPIDPDESRRLFIQHALVEGQFQTDAPFYSHNEKLIQEIRGMESRCRKRDLLAGTQERFDFYNTRVPQGITNGQLFDRWRRDAERKQPQILFMTRAHLMRHLASHITPAMFPDFIENSGFKLKIDYLFEPGDPADGVTVNLPLAVLNQISSSRFEWLVPGLLEEKIGLLIKSLPKQVRTSFVPAPEFARRAFEGLTPCDLPLTQMLGELLTRLTGQPIIAADWQPRELPDYLCMNFRIIDDNNRTVMMGRDLAAIQAKLAQEARRSLSQIQHPLNRDGITKWDFGDLPKRVEVKLRGLTLSGYPAIVDAGNGVSLRLVDTLESARQTTRGGVRRLLVIELANEMKYLARELPSGSFQKMVVQFAPLGKADELQKLILEAAVERVFGDTGDIRTHEEFELRLQGCWHKLPKTVQEVSALCGQILTEFHGVSLRLSAKVPLMWTPSVDDVREQLSMLITKDFLTQTPADWLPELPRYLRGMALRLQKLAGAGGGLQRDEKARMEISPLWLAYLRRKQEHLGRGLRDEVLEQYRWLLEELRISLFAQELGTKVSVSVPRLLKVWEQIQR